VTDGTYQAAFLTTREGVVLFDAAASIGRNLQRAVDEIAAANGVSNKVTHLVYSHHHAGPHGRSSLFGNNVVRIGRRRRGGCCCGTTIPDGRPRTRRLPITASWRSVVNASSWPWHGSNHTPDNSFIHFPDHDTLMLVDIVNSGWVPIYSLNLSEDVPGYIERRPLRSRIRGRT